MQPANTTETGLPEGLAMLADFPGYGVTPDGEVWRCHGLKRGRYAGRGSERLTPSIHPRGHQWYVHVRDKDGVRVRVSIGRLRAMAFGVDAGGSLPHT